METLNIKIDTVDGTVDEIIDAVRGVALRQIGEQLLGDSTADVFVLWIGNTTRFAVPVSLGLGLLAEPNNIQQTTIDAAVSAFKRNNEQPDKQLHGFVVEAIAAHKKLRHPKSIAENLAMLLGASVILNRFANSECRHGLTCKNCALCTKPKVCKNLNSRASIVTK